VGVGVVVAAMIAAASLGVLAMWRKRDERFYWEQLEERTRVNAELKTFDRQRRLALDAARMGWWRYDPMTQVASWDDRYREIFGVAGESGPVDAFLTRLHSDDLPDVWSRVEAALDPMHPQPYSAEYRIHLPNGTMKWIEAHGAASFEGVGKDRRATSLVGTVADITERKDAAEALRESEHRLSRAQEIAHLGSWELDLRTDRLAWSDEVYRIFGLEPQSFAATYEAFLEAVHPDDREAVDKAYSTSVREGKDVYEIEHRIVRKGNGEVRIVEERCQHFRNESGRIVRSVGMVHDITERKRAEEELSRAYGGLEEKVAERTQELVERNEELASEMIERREAERYRELSSDLLRFFAGTYDRKGYLDRAVECFRELSGCRCAGIRLLAEDGEIAFESAAGYERGFRESENHLMIGRDGDQCVCSRVIQGAVDEPKSRFLTSAGSFFCNDTTAFVEGLSVEDRAQYRGVCLRYGFASLAVIPIRFRDTILGAIHLADERKEMMPATMIERVETMATLIGEGMARLASEESLQQTHRTQSVVNELLQLSFKGASLEDVLCHALDALFEMSWLHLDRAGRAFLLEGGSGVLELMCQRGVPEEVARKCERVPFGTCVCGQSLERREILLAPHLHEGLAPECEEEMPFCGLCVPILQGERRIGVLNLQVGEGFQRSREKDEHLLAVAGALANIIVHLQTEGKLFEAQRELSDARRLSDIGSLAATVAHELRNPLGVMKTALYNLKRKSENPAIEKHVEHIGQKIDESSRIIDNLLFYTRIKRPAYAQVQIVEVLKESIAAAESQCGRRDLSIEMHVEAIAELAIEADALQMREVFTNIIDNACQALPAEGGWIGIEGVLDAEHHLRISIRDNGSGIDPEDLGRIFEPFFTRRTHGTGLGLALCRELVHLHHGRIEVESEEGKGTRMTVILPIRS
jgi:PAS domain S-box-containing protein